MIHILLLYLPCTFCIGFLLIYLLRRDRSMAHRFMTICIAFLSIQFFANAQYFSSYDDFLSLVLSMLLRHFTTPLLPFVSLMYLITLAGTKIKTWQSVFFITFPIFVGATCATIYFLVGIDQIAIYLKDLEKLGCIPDVYKSNKYFMAYENICWHAYIAIIWFECAYLVFRAFKYLHQSGCGFTAICDFFIRRGRLQPLQLQSVMIILIVLMLITRTCFSRWFFLSYPLVSDVVCFLQAIILLHFFLVGLYTKQRYLTLQFILAPITSEDSKSLQEATLYQQNREGELLQQFSQLMETRKPYLQYSLKLDDLAAMLNTNRQYLSHMINTEYQQTFPDFINSLRIKCAKEYMLAHPDAHQEDIARHSGFNSAQTFNRRFKIDEGQTPAEWLAATVASKSE